jgi:LmbE family N-acetylglucosaminyl deacetylase
VRILLLVSALLLARPVAADGGPAPLAIHERERLVIVAPHPDDETLAAAGLARHVIAHGGSVRVVLMTAGDGYVEAVVHASGLPRPRPAEYIAYGERRLRETRAALREIGGPAIRLQLLGFPDGGLDQLLHGYWRRSHPEPSPTTRATEPPYPESVARDIAYDGEDLRRELLHLFREAQPTMVAFPDPIDRHPDHRATGLFTLLALETWARDGGAVPRLLAYLVHWPDWPPGWNDEHGGSPGTPLALPADLPHRGLPRVVLALTDADVAAKRNALARYASQEEQLRPFLAAFVRRSEPFTVFPPDEIDHVDRTVERHLARH